MQMTISTKKFDKEISKKTYEDLDKISEKILNITEDNLKQIIKDISRTYPTYKMFKSEKTQKKLENVLRAFSKQYKHICYFQGMNFIVGFFLYHCEEHVAFWLFVSLIDEYEMSALFREGFPGLKIHVSKITKIVKSNKICKEIDELFTKLKVNYQIIMIEWLYSLFSSTIPLEIQTDFYFGFFNQGWIFFYKMCISCFLQVPNTVTETEDVYIYLKFDKFKANNIQENIKIWKKIIDKAYHIDLI